MATDYIIVLVTAESKQKAEKIANHLLNDKLIACANIVGPVKSLYCWSGKIEHNDEWLTIMKTRQNLFERLTEVVKTLHSYEVPEILALPIIEGSKDYLDWMQSCLI